MRLLTRSRKKIKRERDTALLNELPPRALDGVEERAIEGGVARAMIVR